MKKLKFLKISLIIGLLFFFVAACKNSGSKKTEKDSTGNVMVDNNKTMNAGMSEGAVNLKLAMRKLWEEHIVYTRNVICCLVDNLPGADEAVKRLLQNQDDIGNGIKPYYGDDAGNKLTAFLHDHITISADVVKAAKASDNGALDAANKKWYNNADEISSFLSGANPNWKLDDMKSMMHDHLKLTTDEAVARIKKDYAADVKAYDKVHDEILMMADGLTDGIVKQFPDKFK